MPVLVRRPRRRAIPCAAAGGGDAGPRPRRQRAGAVVAARRAARLRRVRRQGGSDPVQRLGGAAAVRPRHAPQGQALADRRRVRRAAPARAERAKPVDAGVAGRRGADRGDIPHVDHEVVDAQRVSGHSAAVPREDRRPHRGVGSGPALADGSARLAMPSDPQRCRRRSFASAPRAGRISAARQVGAVPRAVRRTAQGDGGADRGAARVGRAISRHRDTDRRPRRRGRTAGGGRPLAGHLHFLGQVDDAAKASAMRSADVYCAPNTGGESFGIVLVEAMAARPSLRPTRCRSSPRRCSARSRRRRCSSRTPWPRHRPGRGNADARPIGRPPPAVRPRRRGRRSGSRCREIARPKPEEPRSANPSPCAVRRTGRGTAPTCQGAGIRPCAARTRTTRRRRHWEFARRPSRAPPSASAGPDRTPRCGRRSSRGTAGEDLETR